MKKLLLATALIISTGFGAKAQFSNDAFFNNWEESNRLMESGFGLVLPTAHGFGEDTPAPLGSGLLILTALGAGYAVKRRRKNC